MNKIKDATDFIKEKLGSKRPTIGVILGSGLGSFADKVQDPIIIDYNEIPHFHATTVKGHSGKLVIGSIGEAQVAVFQGRFHYYEGHKLDTVVLPVRVLAKIGCKKLILTNAAGGINSEYSPGDLVCLTDHINLTGSNPLIGKNNDELGVRFPDMSEAYSSKLASLLFDIANEMDLNLKAGVYAGVLGPSYETPAEIQMLKVLGADMVGMSTVPESIAANHAGLQVCAVSCITNLAAGISKEKLDHDDVKDVANQVITPFTKLLERAVIEMEKLY